MTVTIKCPTCKKNTTWTDNPFRPFCCERCKNQDLSNWADGSYAIGTEEGKSTNSEEE